MEKFKNILKAFFTYVLVFMLFIGSIAAGYFGKGLIDAYPNNPLSKTRASIIESIEDKFSKNNKDEIEKTDDQEVEKEELESEETTEDLTKTIENE